ncbi:MAG TPA: serine hydrolase domain-containing protein, partial [Terrimicrobiaceae bacterium]
MFGRVRAAVVGVMLGLIGTQAQAQTADEIASPPATSLPESATAPVQGTSSATVSWRSVRDAVLQLDKQTKKEMTRTGLPGVAIAVVFKDRVVYAKGFGVTKVGGQTRVNSKTVFQLASLSKPVGSTVVAALVGKGIVSWDSRIADLDPSFAMFDPAVTSQVTIRDFYSHRSGLPDHAGDLLEDLGFKRTEILRRLRYQPPGGPFRQFYAYTNFGLTEGAIAAAKAAGKPWEVL